MSDAVASFSALRTALQGFTSLPLFWPNDGRTPSPDIAPNGYVYSEARIFDEGQIELGSNGARRDFGEFEIWVLVPRGSLSGQAETYAQQIRALFGVVNVSGIVVSRKLIEGGRIVPTNHGRMYCVPVRVEWWADRTDVIAVAAPGTLFGGRYFGHRYFGGRYFGAGA